LQVTGPVPTTSGVQTAVPIGATGVLLNVTVINATRSGFLSVRPGDASGAPSTSSLNFAAGDVVPNAVQVGLPTVGANAGKIDITYDALGAAGPTTDVLIDVVGFSTELDAYTKAQTDAAIAAAVDTTRVQTVTAGGASASFVFPAAQLQLGSTTNITTTRAEHLDLHFIGTGGLQCSNAFAANIAWIELNGTPVRSSVTQWGSGIAPFDQRLLRGITATSIPAGTHQLRAQLACTSGTITSGAQLGNGSWIVSVLAGTPSVAALVAPDVEMSALPEECTIGADGAEACITTE
jgi:hypothetical protein